LNKLSAIGALSCVIRDTLGHSNLGSNVNLSYTQIAVILL
jgi:hypothetical protein